MNSWTWCVTAAAKIGRRPSLALVGTGAIFAHLSIPHAVMAADRRFPAATWEQREPAQLGLDAATLDLLAQQLGGRGCIIKDGYVVKTWGDQAKRGDWFSSAKPVLSTMLFFAIEEGLVKNVDQPIADFGWPLKDKDRSMTLRHLGGMISGYARPEPPGAAWAYNDYAIQLYQKTLFDKVFKGDARQVCEDPSRLGALGFEDGLRFSEKRRIFASVRDWARIAWFWLNRGHWAGRQVLPQRYFDEYMKPQVPRDLPISQQAPTDDYLAIGTYGGESSHFSDAGPGTYGFNWWFNAAGRNHRDRLLWPDAPQDTIYTAGARGNCSAIIPSLGLIVVAADARWGELLPNDPEKSPNGKLKLAAAAAGYDPARHVAITGTMRKWQPVTVSFTGPELAEDGDPNPFLDRRLDVTFACGDRTVVVPGYFAADGNGAETGASAGRVWRAHLLPDREGTWTYRAGFRKGAGIAVTREEGAGEACDFDGVSGSFTVGPPDKAASGFLSKGLLQHRGGDRYLRFAETGEYFIKGGADSPENFLAFADFDQTTPTLRYTAHAADWRIGDPTWRDRKGKNIIGALNYLASRRMNSVYMITMNVKGDGDDVWPWTGKDERRRFDCSKLDQWEIVFDHMDRLGLMLHLLHQEQENDQLLDQGELGPDRKLYYRELIARFAHHPALVWNLGEENTNTDTQRKAFAKYIRELDPYDHPIVVHTFPHEIEKVYAPLLGYPFLDGPSLQLGKMELSHEQTLTWVQRSQEAGRPWFVCLDEIGPADTCVRPDAEDPEHPDIMRHALWGHLMAGGAGVEWIFAYNTWPRQKARHQDTACEDWRPWERVWDLTAVALEFFRQHLPFTQMQGDDTLVEPKGRAWCLAKPGEVYAVYVWGDTEAKLKLPDGSYAVHWYDPRKGGDLISGPVLAGPGLHPIGRPPSDGDKDWVALVRAASPAEQSPRAALSTQPSALTARFDEIVIPLVENGIARPGTNAGGEIAWGDSYRLAALAEMFERTREARYAELFIRLADWVAAARDHLHGKQDAWRGRALPAWGSTTYSGGKNYVWAVHTGVIAAPMARFAATVRIHPALAAQWGQDADRLLEVAEQAAAVHDDQYRPGPGPDEGHVYGLYVKRDLPLNMQNALALAWLAIDDANGSTAHRDRITRLARYLKNRLRTGEDGAYDWAYWPPLDGPGTESEDISHAAINVEFMVRCCEHGIAFTRDDLLRIEKTLLKRVLQPDGRVADTVGGKGGFDRYRSSPLRWGLLARHCPGVREPLLALLGSTAAGASTDVLMGAAYLTLPASQPATQAPEARAKGPPVYKGHDLLTVIDDEGRVHPVRNAADWQQRREHIIANMLRVMGPVPRQWQTLPLDVKITGEEKLPGLVRKRITFRAEPEDEVAAYLMIPSGRAGRLPAMLCLPQTVDTSKDEPVGLGPDRKQPYALELTQRGFVTLTPDYWPFGDYRTKKYNPSDHGYVSGTMKGIWNHMRAIDVLQSLPEVDPERIGSIGHSLGGHNTLWLAALDPRVKVAATSCGFTSMPAYAASKYGGGSLKNYAQDRYMPRIATEFGNDPQRVPWDFQEVLAAVAPRPVFINAPVQDINFDVAGVRDCVSAAAKVYAWMGAADALKTMYPEAQHVWPPDVRTAAYEFIEKALAAPARKG